MANYRSVRSPGERLGLLFKSSIGALADPKRADLVSECGDLSSQSALTEIRNKMMASETGRLILEECPRVNSETWPLEKMLELEKNSFGHQYAAWMSKHEFSSDERPLVKYV